eukprot:XP_001699022.1 hypothetical protein CHLREDRAFT_152048 [Chlamydomonas reinhardtii]
MFGATCGAVTVAVGFYVHTPAITWPVVVVGLLGVILGVVLAHRQATGRGWNAGSASIYALGALVLRRRQEQEEEEEEAQWRAQQAQPPWPPQPLQPWRVAQVVGSRYYMPVYCACPLDDVGSSSGSGSGSGSVVDGYENQQVQKLPQQQKQAGVAPTKPSHGGAEEGGGDCGDGSLRRLSSVPLPQQQPPQQQHPLPLQQQEQARPEAQPPQLPLQPEEEEWADAASEAETGACGGDGGGLGAPPMMSGASQQQHQSGGVGDLGGTDPLAVPAAAAAAAARSGSAAA